MVSTATVATFDLLAGSLASLGLLYLLSSDALVVHYRRFFRPIAFGLPVYAVTGPVVGEFAPAHIHAVHGIAALFVALGLADLLRASDGSTADFEALLAPDASDSADAPDPEPGLQPDDGEELP